MGFTKAISPITGKECLCCDFCDGFKGDSKGTTWVKKIKCPFGYCQSWATCNKCFKEKKHKLSSIPYRPATLEINHEGCRIEQEKHEKRKNLEAKLWQEGQWLRRSAIRADNGSDILVTFRNKDGLECVCSMSEQTYDSIPLLEPATISDYEKFGKVDVIEEGEAA